MSKDISRAWKTNQLSLFDANQGLHGMVTAGVYSLFITVEDQIGELSMKESSRTLRSSSSALCLLAYHFRLEFAHRLLTRRLCLIGLLNCWFSWLILNNTLHVRC